VETRGGAVAGRSVLKRFLASRLRRYAEERNHPDDDVASGLSPYLHFGHVGAWEVLGAVAGVEDGPLVRPRPPANGARRGWWGLSEAAEGFLDQLVTWRELGLNLQSTWPDYASYASLPEWARRTLAAHARDERPALYDLPTLEAAETHDDIWNAAQRELVREGRMQNYLRMLWGKNILRWTQAPEEAYERCLHLNDKYALDGRDPNSLTGISWVFGRYDRPWGPEREVFGTVRTMTSDSTRRKLHLKAYLARYA
jgi:deoxyribodipyrimidine photo-lyase